MGWGVNADRVELEGVVQLMPFECKAEFIRFLQEDLAIPDEAIDLAVEHGQQLAGPLPMILWQYGLISLQQLERIFDWLEQQVCA